MSATTQVKVLSPEMFHIAQGQGFHFLEANSGADDKVSPSRRAGVFQPWADPSSAESPWQAIYMSAQFLWDKDSDYAALYEEANSLYYGKAWEGGMKEFRKVQEKAFHETSGCFGWGLCSPLGMKCGDGHIWKMNVARSRKLIDGTREMSSCACGQFHNADNFVNVIFSGGK